MESLHEYQEREAEDARREKRIAAILAQHDGDVGHEKVINDVIYNVCRDFDRNAMLRLGIAAINQWMSPDDVETARALKVLKNLLSR